MMIDERMGKLENRSSRMIYHKLITRIEIGQQRRPLRVPVRERQCRRRHHGGIDQPAVPPAGRRQADDHHAAGRLPGRGGRSGGVGAVPHGLRFRPVERRRGPAAVRLRGGASLRLGRPHHRLRPDPPGDLAHRQGRPQIRRVPRRSSTQRPAELDPTIISQCSTLFAMRMSNDRDQALLRSAVSDAAANLFGFVPSLGTREALAFGVGVPLPTRLTFAELPPQSCSQKRGLRRRAGAARAPIATSASSRRCSSAGAARWPRRHADDGSRDPRPAVASRGGAAAARAGTGCAAGSAC